MITKYVLDKGHLALFDSMPSLPVLSLASVAWWQRVVQTARASTQAMDLSEVMGLKTFQDDHKLLKYLWTNGHLSPFEHVVLTWHIKCPLFVRSQWHRHRTWSYNEMSLRYQEAIVDEFYNPPTFRLQDTKNKQGSAGDITTVQDTLARAVWHETLQKEQEAYQELLSYGIAREQARALLGSGLYTEFYGTVNLRNCLDFIRQRNHPHAQEEIRVYTEAMQAIIMEVDPTLAEVVFA